MSTTIPYRPEVDGLRAIAVGLVVLFHAQIAGFGGGYVGVDVFFVISGYLITSFILKDLETGEFSLLTFWERRARRILPAAAVVIVATLVVGWFILIPRDLRDLGQSAFAQSLFASNIFFWLKTGYFDRPAEVAPLLHTWSLAVEEQFYLVFPLLLLALVRFGAGTRLRVIVALMAVSFAASVWAVANYPAAAFYLATSRAWELLLGAFVALNVLRRPPDWFAEGASWVALAVIVAVAVVYDRNTPFPGWAAAAPTVATAAIIWANGGRLTSAGRLLALRPMVAIGLLSYSLYLWHWPVLVFYRYIKLEPLVLGEKVLLIAASVLLAWLSWKLVELPVRYRLVFPSRRQIAAASTFALMAIGAVGLSAHFTGGYPLRLPADALRYASAASDQNPRRAECHTIPLAQVEADRLCLLRGTEPGDRPVLLSWGDSHADAVMPVVERLAESFGVKGWHASYTGCVPVLFVRYARRADLECAEFNRAMRRIVERRQIKHVLLVAYWNLYVDGKGGEDFSLLVSDDETVGSTPEMARAVFRKNLKKTIEVLRAAGAEVWIMRQAPLQTAFPPQALTRLALGSGDPSGFGRTLADHRRLHVNVNAILDEVAGDGVHILDPAVILCGPKGFCGAARNGESLYRDEDHLSNYGAMQLVPMFEPMFRAIAKNDRRE